MNFIWNHKNKKGKVHMMVPGEAMDWHTHKTINPACPGQITHWAHSLCKPSVFKFVDSPIKTRVSKDEYTFASTFPEGKTLCESCLDAHIQPEVCKVRAEARKRITKSGQ